jgi:hypothetical protein
MLPGGSVYAVFNAIAADVGAFGPAERTYIQSLGTIVNVAIAVMLDVGQEGA